MNETCWADPLTRSERTILARKLARACHSFYGTALQANDRHGSPESVRAWTITSAEMSDLHLDVTERAA